MFFTHNALSIVLEMRSYTFFANLTFWKPKWLHKGDFAGGLDARLRTVQQVGDVRASSGVGGGGTPQLERP